MKVAFDPFLKITAILAFLVLPFSCRAAEKDPFIDALKIYGNCTPGSPEDLAAQKQIRETGTNGIKRITEWILDSSHPNHSDAALAFEVFGPDAAPAVPVLERMIYGANEELMIDAVIALGNIGLPATAALLKAATNDNFFIRAPATSVLAKFGTNAAPAVAFFLKDLHNSDRRRVDRAAHGLCDIGLDPEIVIPAITNLLSDRRSAVRFSALTALHPAGSGFNTNDLRKALPALLPFLKGDIYLRPFATNVIEKIAPETFSSARPN